MSNYSYRVTTATVTIANGATDSGAVNVQHASIVGIRTPAALTGTSFTLQDSDDGTTFYPVYDASGSPVTISVGTSRTILFTASDFIALNKYLRFVSSGAEAAERSITVLLRGID